MPKTHIAKLFKNGASQAVRLPAEFRFEGNQVYISRDAKTNNVILSEKPGAGVWDEFFEFVREGFSQPRKTLANNLAKFGKAEVFAALEVGGLSKSVRPHELGLEEWRSLYRRVEGRG